MGEVVDAFADRRPKAGVNLGIRTVVELVAEEADAPDSKALVAPMLWSDDYGVYAAKPKVGKSWLAQDLAVSLTTGTPFLEHYPVDGASVLMFAGEGGRRRVLRRLEAIVRSRGGELGDLANLHVSLLAPVVNDAVVRDAMTEALTEHPADLIIAEPFYLMGRGVGRSQLNEIGAVLGVLQELAQEARAALLIGDHWNKGGEGIGAQRITGAGMAEWARVLFNGLVDDSRTDTQTRATTVDLRWDVSGEMADFGFKYRREVWEDTPGAPASRLNYRCTFLGEHDPSTETVLLEDALKYLHEARKVDAREVTPAKHTDVYKGAGMDGRRGSEALKQLVALGKMDHGAKVNGTTYDVWILEEDA